MSCPNNEATKLESKKNEECKENCEFNHNYNPNSSCVLTNACDSLLGSQSVSIGGLRCVSPARFKLCSRCRTAL